MYSPPPLAHEAVMERLHFLDKMGDRWWPMTAAVYLVVAKKRVLGVTPMPLAWKRRRLVVGPAAAPAARGMVVPFHRRRLKRLG